MLYQLSYARNADLTGCSCLGDATRLAAPGLPQALRNYGSGEMTSYR